MGVAWPAPAGLAETVERGDCAGSPLPTLPAGHAGHPLPRPSPTAKSRTPNPQPRSLPGQPRPGSRPIPLRAATPAHPGVTQPLGVRRRGQQRPVARPCGERGNVPRPGVGQSPAAPGDLCTPALTVTNRNVERCSPREPRRPRGPRARSGWRVTLPAGGRRAGGGPSGEPLLTVTRRGADGARSPAVGAGPALGTASRRNHQNKRNTGLRLHRAPRTPAAAHARPRAERSLGRHAPSPRLLAAGGGGAALPCALREPLPDIAYYGPGFHDHESGRSERLSSESPAEPRPVPGCSARVCNRVGPKRSGS